jgi:hypothetical protein
MALPITSNNGAVSVTIHEIIVSRPRRMIMASDRPIRRALSRWCGGTFSARMAMKMRLSMPSTISSTTSVSKPTQMFGSNNHSIMRFSF